MCEAEVIVASTFLRLEAVDKLLKIRNFSILSILPPGTGCEVTICEGVGLYGSICSVSGIGYPPISTPRPLVPKLVEG
jgi:hypothetical protein